MKTLAQLIELSRTYFIAKIGLSTIFATSDGNFFYPECESDARYHAKRNKFEVYRISRDIAFKPVETEEKIPEVQPESKKNSLLKFKKK